MRLGDFDAFLFDLDGTLVHSMGMWKEIDFVYLARFGITPPPDLQKDLEGLRFEEVAVYFRSRFGIRDDIHTIMDDWQKMAEEMYRNVPLRDGTRAFLSCLKERGKKCAIVTSNHDGLTEICLTAHGIRQYFDLVVTCDTVRSNKPEPDVYLYAARHLDTDPAKCLVFEDLPFGIMAGKEAGMRVIAVEDVYSAPVREEKRRLADKMIDSFEELLKGGFCEEDP